MRGEIFTILDKTFFAFGGAQSHDIQDGILEKDDTKTIKEWSKSYSKMFRINHVSWWKEEMASEEEMLYAKQNLLKHHNTVDFVITHCMPQDVCYWLGFNKPDNMTTFFNDIAKTINFKYWFGGHYHTNQKIMMKYCILYEQIIRIV